MLAMSLLWNWTGLPPTYTYNTHMQIRPKTLNPQWKERFELRMYDGDSTTLHMEVWDKDFPQSDDFIGG